jgi:sugar phosphate permease
VVLRDAPTPEEEPAAATQPAPKIRFGEALASLLGSGPFWLVLAFCILQGAGGYAVIGWMPTYMQEHFHMRQGTAGISATGYGNLTELAGLAIGGFWADRWSRTEERGRIYVLAIGVCAAVPGVFLAGASGLFVFAVIGLMLWGLSNGFINSNLMPIICLTSDRRYRATAYGATNLAASVAGGLAIYGAGLLRDRQFDFGHMLMLASVVLLFCPVLLLRIRTESVGQASPNNPA